MKTPETVTVFDVDGTLLQPATTLLVAKALREDGFVPSGLREESSALEALRDKALATGDGELGHTYTSQTGLFVARTLQGMSEGDTQAHALQTSEAWRDLIFDEMRQPLNDARKGDGPAILVSRGPDVYIKMLAQCLGLNGGSGRSPEQFLTRNSPSKLEVSTQLCTKLGITARGRVVYGDSGSDDYPLMADRDTVRAFAVNADSTLRQNVEAHRAEPGQHTKWQPPLDCRAWDPCVPYGELV